MMGDSYNKIQYIGIFIFLVILFSLSKIVRLVTDYWWFDALGFREIFMISLKTKIFLFVAAAAIFFVFAMLNMWIASRFHNKDTNLVFFRIKFLIIAFVSFAVGIAASVNWFTFQQYLNQVPFNLADPIFFKDVAFYVFSLPFLLAVWKFAMACVIITTVLVVLDYFQSFLFALMRPPKAGENLKDFPSFKSIMAKLKRKALFHMTVLASLVFLLLAGKHYLTRYSIMYSKEGIVVGAGYADVMVFLPIMKILMVLAIIIVVLFYFWLFVISRSRELKKKHIVGTIIVLYLLFAFLGPTVIPALVQALRVSPNELNLEKPYIENNIRFTKIAYGLDDVVEKDFEAVQELTADILENAPETIDNVRLLDWRPLTSTYKQTQEIRLYYDLSGIDIDRYEIDGKYTEVMLAPRELNQDQIASNAKTWVNLHMVYTHGFGVVMSPVNEVTTEGLPNFFIKDIPPVTSYDNLKIDQPRIYYGEKDNEFVLVNTGTEEFDFPQGTTNQYINYDGKGGVTLSSFLRKVLMALRFTDVKILLSSDINSDSKIMFDRDIQRRVNKITPFLVLDQDPYLVISDGRLYWIQDAYTVSGNFPYSEKLGKINYIRNSVKVVIDAYDGSVSYYIADVNDPIIQTYANIFPEQFKSMDDMPLKDHIRYPADLFEVQSSIYTVYHMSDPTVFYNKEDAWQIPYEIYGTGQKVSVEPYYVIIKLPGEDKEEFILMTSFSPIKKDNMISWFAARSDGDNYGKLLLYKFPKDKLVYGPLQIEAKFDQDSEISQQLTLWSQQGSSVTRGNLLIIPIEDSLLYIEPLYLQAETGKLPQLKRVLASDGEKVVMELSLADALEALFGKAKVTSSTSNETRVALDGTSIQDANEYYDAILKAMEDGDWEGIGQNLENLGDVLKALEEEWV